MSSLKSIFIHIQKNKRQKLIALVLAENIDNNPGRNGIDGISLITNCATSLAMARGLRGEVLAHNLGLFLPKDNPSQLLPKIGNEQSLYLKLSFFKNNVKSDYN